MTFRSVLSVSAVVAIFLAGILLRIGPHIDFSHIGEGNLSAYYFDKFHRIATAGSLSPYDIWEFAPDDHPENVPPGVPYVAAGMFAIVRLIAPKMTPMEFAPWFPVIIYALFGLIAFFLFAMRERSMFAALMLLAVISFAPIFASYTEYAYFVQEPLGALFAFLAAYFLAHYRRSRADAVAAVASFGALALTWQQFPLFVLSVAVLAAAACLMKQFRTGGALLMLIAAGLVLAEFLSRIVIGIQYSVFGMLKEIVLGAWLLRIGDPDFLTAMTNMDWRRSTPLQVFRWYGPLTILLLLWSILVSWQRKKDLRYLTSLVFALAAAGLLWRFQKERIFAFGLLLYPIGMAARAFEMHYTSTWRAMQKRSVAAARSGGDTGRVLQEATPGRSGGSMRKIAFFLTRNASQWIGDAVRRLKDAGWMVIVLENGSTDDTAEVARQHGAEVLKFRHHRPSRDVLRHGFAYAKREYPDAEHVMVIAGRRAEFDPRWFAEQVKRNARLSIYAPFWIWPSAVWEFSRVYVRPRHIVMIAKDAIPAIVAIGFAISIFVEINRSLDAVKPPVFRVGESGIVAQERRSALEWLARHSPKDAVVMADQFDGNYIVAFANRRPVSSSKVYPSEAKEVSRRYEDISKFFFATDEGAALAIAEPYRVDYVFVTTEFSYSKNCKLANACQFVASGELTPVGRKLTLIGKMLGREPLENFELIWDSPNFSIFRIKNDRTSKNPCRLTQDEELTALKIARGAPNSLGQECAVAVSAYRNGERFGPVVVSGKPLGEAIREAAAEILSAVGSEVKLQIAVWSEEELVRRDINIFLDRSFDATKVLVMEREGKRAVFLPDEFNTRIWNSNTEVLDTLCVKLGSPTDCWRQETNIFVAPVTVFAEDAQRGVLPISGTLPVLPEIENFSESVFRERLVAARDWIWRMRTEMGDFRNEIDPRNPAETPGDTRLASLHGAAETWWLLEYHRAVPDRPEVVAFGRAQSDRFEQLINSGNEERTAFLIYAGLENLSLWRITGDQRYLERASRYAGMLRQLFVDGANLARSFRVRNGAPEIVSSKSVGTIGNNSGLYFLAETLREREHPVIRGAVRKFADALRDNFRKNRILDPDISIVWESWLVNAFASVSAVTQNRQDAEFALEVANWILDYQSRDLYPHLRGAFRGRAATSGVGKITEALVEAAILAPKIGENPSPYLEGFREAMRWLMTMQYGDASYFLPEASRSQMAGALRSGVTDLTAEIDNAGHMVIAGAWYLRQFPTSNLQ